MKLFRNLQKGFTLIELLVVIGVLGILAAGLLATIDPLEQFRKGADSNRKTTSLELVNAFTRYYSVHGVMPWAAVADGGAGCNAGGTVPPDAQEVSGATAPNAFNDCLTTLVNEGELKDTFPQQYNVLSKLKVTELTSGGNPSVAVCFDPESKSESSRPETKYSPNPSGAVCDPTTDSTCHWCAQ